MGALCLPKRELYPALTTFVAGVIAGWAAEPENAASVATALIDEEIVDAVGGAPGGLTPREVERIRIEARHAGAAEAHARMGLTELLVPQLRDRRPGEGRNLDRRARTARAAFGAGTVAQISVQKRRMIYAL